MKRSYTIASLSIATLMATVLTPSFSNAATLPVISSQTRLLLNTGYGGIGTPLAAGSVDQMWQLATINSDVALGHGSQSAYVDAIVVERTGVPGAAWSWGAEVGILNAVWIAANKEAYHATAGDFLFRARFQLATSVNPATFSLPMSFLVDDYLIDIYVNGVGQRQYGQIPPVESIAFDVARAGNITIDRDWRAGENELIVRVKSIGEPFGLLAAFPSVPNALNAEAPVMKRTFTQLSWSRSVMTPMLGEILDLVNRPVRVGGESNAWLLETSGAIRSALPASGVPTPLTGLTTNGRLANELAGQAVAATLNLRGFAGLGDQIVAAGPYRGRTARYLLNLANSALNGDLEQRNKVTDLTAALASLNSSYINGVSSGFLRAR